jgi:hypothetical protein
MGPVRDIGTRLELFVDQYLVSSLNGTQLKLQHPIPRGVAIRYDAPWEREGGDGYSESFYTTVVKDDDIYRMYYRGHMYWTCYAESIDGINWKKPSLGLIDAGGTKENNVILTDTTHSAFSVFVDTKPGVPDSERYKANLSSGDLNESTGGLVGYVSGDGIHWRTIQDKAIVAEKLPNHFDSQNVMFWSEIESRYLLYCRYMAGNNRIRATARQESEDFLNWSDPVPMQFSDTGSATPSAHLYTNQTTPYFRAPHIYISLAARIFFERLVSTGDEEGFAANEGTPRSRTPGDCSDGVLMTTRSGTHTYDFTFKESQIRPGIGYPNWTTRNNYPAAGVVQTGPTEMSLYVNRHYEQNSAYLERMTLRLDGFASVNAPFSGGEMLTNPLQFSGNQLVLNYSTSAAGSIRVELLDSSGRPIQGYRSQDCRELIGDEIERVVTWNGVSDVSSLAGKPIQVRFLMKDADLFSLRFVKP